MLNDDCGCIRCTDERVKNADMMAIIGTTLRGPGMKYWRYNCEICGNKRCPHHSDHTLTCTGSNEPGQEGSVYR